MAAFTMQTSVNNTTYCKDRPIEYLVIHYTAGTSSKTGSALDSCAWFNNPSAKCSADFIVDDTMMVQKNPDIHSRYCWAVGGKKYANTKGGTLYGKATNRNCISIEICSTNDTRKITEANDSHYSFTDAAIQTAAKLAKILMAEYNIPMERVIRHYDVNGKPCPGIKGWGTDGGSDATWQRFKYMLTATSAAAAPTTTTGGYDMAVLPTLKKGSNGDTVKALQAMLNGYGYSCGTVDGGFGSKTATALLAYQKATGLYADSVCGPKTWAKLLGA